MNLFQVFLGKTGLQPRHGGERIRGSNIVPPTYFLDLDLPNTFLILNPRPISASPSPSFLDLFLPNRLLLERLFSPGAWLFARLLLLPPIPRLRLLSETPCAKPTFGCALLVRAFERRPNMDVLSSSSFFLLKLRALRERLRPSVGWLPSSFPERDFWRDMSLMEPMVPLPRAPLTKPVLLREFERLSRSSFLSLSTWSGESGMMTSLSGSSRAPSAMWSWVVSPPRSSHSPTTLLYGASYSFLMRAMPLTTFSSASSWSMFSDTQRMRSWRLSIQNKNMNR
mmetsp:Transcript_12404/g.31322  ORF Transcript_12404/g.31322 Transcript_12404/m.31322 type:complete len:282 (+) Transcript_12404:144-989(+)